MSEKKFKISPAEKREADYIFVGMKELQIEIERCKQFKVGDYLVAREVNWSDDNQGFNKDVNYTYTIGDIVRSRAYNIPKKFVVVYVNADGIPFYKRLTASGKPIGYLTPCVMNILEAEMDCSYYYMQLDPDYADAIILDSQTDFDPSAQNKVKVSLYKEITEHNKKHKIKALSYKAFDTFLSTLKQGDTLWKSVSTFYTVQTVERITRRQAEAKFPKLTFDGPSEAVVMTFRKIWVADTIDSKGKHKIFCIGQWSAHSNLYSQKPRSYRELKDQ